MHVNAAAVIICHRSNNNCSSPNGITSYPTRSDGGDCSRADVGSSSDIASPLLSVEFATSKNVWG